MKRTAYYWDSISLEHDTGSHAETIARAERLRPETMIGLIPGLDARPVERHETVDWICRIHDREYHDWVRSICAGGGGLLDAGDTPVSERSYDAAIASVDALLTAADAIVAGDVNNAFSAMRPPGHHALPSRAMGFCIFANVSVLARYLQERHGIRRIAIVDFDVHHGNGTQDIFWRDPDVFYASLHEFPQFPGSGTPRETGEGPGAGATLNVPILPGTSEADYLAELESKVLPAVRGFAPDFLIVSAGFDAHVADPIGGLRLSDDGYTIMTRALRALAAEHCGGRIISSLEGGYNLDALARSVAAHVRALME